MWVEICQNGAFVGVNSWTRIEDKLHSFRKNMDKKNQKTYVANVCRKYKKLFYMYKVKLTYTV